MRAPLCDALTGDRLHARDPTRGVAQVGDECLEAANAISPQAHEALKFMQVYMFDVFNELDCGDNREDANKRLLASPLGEMFIKVKLGRLDGLADASHGGVWEVGRTHTGCCRVCVHNQPLYPALKDGACSCASASAAKSELALLGRVRWGAGVCAHRSPRSSRSQGVFCI